jgi:anti-sigma regulatory factor (Ser/Thr protein kinase)
VLKPPTPSFRHQVAFYEDADAYLERTVPFIREGLDGDEAVLVAVPEEKAELLRGELGTDAGAIGLEDITEFGRNPARIIPVWRGFAERYPVGTPIRGIGEPIWPGREADELEECHRHEALLNRAFGDAAGFTLLCPYDSAALPDADLQRALHTHPELAGRDSASLASPSWGEGGTDPGPFAGELAAPPSGAPEFRYGVADLHELRAFAARAAASAGLSDERAEDLILAASELAANSVVHGGGRGRATAWDHDGALFFETRDEGRIDDALAGRVRPAPTEAKGRGLWMANQLSDLVQVRSSATGTAVRLRFALD